MGQSSSTAREPARGIPHSSTAAAATTTTTTATRTYNQSSESHSLANDAAAFAESTEVRAPRTLVRQSLSTRQTSSSSIGRREPRSTYRRETRARSSPIIGGEQPGHAHDRDNVLLEQEEHPLILRDMDIRVNDGPITNIQAGPMPARPSIISRLSSRVVRRRQTDGRAPLLSVTDDGIRSRRGLGSRRHNLQSGGADDGARRNRFSMFDFSTTNLQTSQRPSRTRRLSLIEQPSLTGLTTGTDVFDPSPLSPVPPATPSSTAASPDTTLPTSNNDDRTTSPGNQRLQRHRHSLLTSFNQLFRPARARHHRAGSSSHDAGQVAEEAANLISPQGTGGGGHVSDGDSHPLSSSHLDTEVDRPRDSPESESPESSSTSAPTSRHESQLEVPLGPANSLPSGVQERPNSRLLSTRDRPRSWISNPSDSSRDVRRRSRRFSSILGIRPTRAPRREDDTPLSRVLQLAATAIATQLSGNTDASSNLDGLGDDSFDGSLNTFIRGLNSAAEASATASRESNASNLPPLNFWRVFRFVHSNGSGPNQNAAGQQDGASSRTVTLVVVGVRSVPSSSLAGDAPSSMDSNTESVLSLPTPGAADQDHGRENSTTPTTSARDRPMDGNIFPSLTDSHRPRSSLSTRLNRSSIRNTLNRSPASSSSIRNRPSSPLHDGGRISRQRTPQDIVAGASSPSSSSSTGGVPTSPIDPSDLRSDEPTRPIRQRPRSESHGHLGAGAARRNGVVEPDTVSSNGRHWLIYVVGTNLSEDHPAFQAPSLFTDNPSYEDMLMLSALLGPAKPPVASEQDVAGAAGVFRLESRRQDGRWAARLLDRSTGSDGVVSPVVDLPLELDRCLVCLTDYDCGDEIRQLQSCTHVFHRECVDTWLTTGRNSCPLCRGNGVEEKANSPPEAPIGSPGVAAA